LIPVPWRAHEIRAQTGGQKDSTCVATGRRADSGSTPTLKAMAPQPKAMRQQPPSSLRMPSDPPDALLVRSTGPLHSRALTVALTVRALGPYVVHYADVDGQLDADRVRKVTHFEVLHVRVCMYESMARSLSPLTTMRYILHAWTHMSPTLHCHRPLCQDQLQR
jgi:hypothetical protein